MAKLLKHTPFLLGGLNVQDATVLPLRMWAGHTGSCSPPRGGVPNFALNTASRPVDIFWHCMGNGGWGVAFSREKNRVGCGYTSVTASFFGSKKN